MKQIVTYLNWHKNIFFCLDEIEYSELVKISDVKEKNNRIRSIKEKIMSTTKYDKKAMKILEFILLDEIDKFDKIKTEIENEIKLENNREAITKKSLLLLLDLNLFKIQFLRTSLEWSKNYAKNLK